MIYHCATNNSFVWLLLVYGFKGILLIFGLFLAWETRKVKIAALNDSHHIGNSPYSSELLSIVKPGFIQIKTTVELPKCWLGRCKPFKHCSACVQFRIFVKDSLVFYLCDTATVSPRRQHFIHSYDFCRFERSPKTDTFRRWLIFCNKAA